MWYRRNMRLLTSKASLYTLLSKAKVWSLFGGWQWALDEFGGVSFTYQHLQQPKLGFNVLVFVVLPSQRWAVFFLHVPVRTKKVEWESNETKQKRTKDGLTLPAVLLEELLLELPEVLADSFLLLTRFLELLHQFLPVFVWKGAERFR